LRAARYENSRSARTASLATFASSPSTDATLPEKHRALTRQRLSPTYYSLTRPLLPTILIATAVILPADSALVG
jgi:hypothetical protein